MSRELWAVEMRSSDDAGPWTKWRLSANAHMTEQAADAEAEQLNEMFDHEGPHRCQYRVVRYVPDVKPR